MDRYAATRAYQRLPVVHDIRSNHQTLCICALQKRATQVVWMCYYEHAAPPSPQAPGLPRRIRVAHG